MQLTIAVAGSSMEDPPHSVNRPNNRNKLASFVKLAAKENNDEKEKK